jgi:phosphatidate cytidylyltransferase
MLRTRLWMGTVLVALAVGMLFVDQQLAPWYPFLFLLLAGLALAACFELLHLLGPASGLHGWFCYTAVAALVVANWPAHLPVPGWPSAASAWPWVVGTLAAVVLGAFLVEMATFREPGGSVTRIALTVWVAGYLGLLPSFFAQLRWLAGPSADGPAYGTAALALAIFVPKCGDIGAYTTGRLLGRHKMTPVLSPKKTWEGAAGGLAAAVGTAIGIDRLGPALVLHGDLLAEVGFGLTVGVAGMLGDLAESLIKRDCRRKDASQAVPGFGGVLDVVDAVLFAAPVAYWWLS